MHYKVVVTGQAYTDLDNIVYYILFELKNEQAARAVLDDFDETVSSLRNCAGSLKFCENKRLRSLGYHRINFLKHEYFMFLPDCRRHSYNR